MDTTEYDDEGTIDLSEYTIVDSCLWLLYRLKVLDFISKAYTLPFCSYVTTWPDAVPITSIVMGQSPYPNDIFSPIAAAMSYDKDLCISKMSREVPPTVEILANDLYINAGMKKQDCIDLIRNGWALIKGGMILVNESVFHNYNSAQGYKESADQCNVIIRLLRETEKYGKRTVDIYAFGESGQRMASNLCSWYKSTTVKLSKHAVTHPAAVSRRFTDFSDINCHMNTPSFSKNFAKCLSNHVALLHTMAKKSEQDIKLQRQADILRNLGENLPKLQDNIASFTESLKEFQTMDSTGNEDLKRVIQKMITNGEAYALRTGLAASLMVNLQTVTQTMSGNVSKSAPSLSMVNPSPTAGTSEDYKQTQSQNRAPSVTSSEVVFRSRKTSKPPTDTSSFQQVSPPASVKSIGNSTVTSVSFRKRPSTASAMSTPSKSNTDNEVSFVTATEPSTPTPDRSMSASFRKQNLTDSSKRLSSSGGVKNNSYALTKDQINQLSSVAAVVQVNKPGVDEDPDYEEYFESIQHDIMQKTHYNTIVKELIECIDKDMKNIPNFNFADWTVPTDVHSDTFDKCKEWFGF